MVVEFLSGESNKVHDNFRSSEWGPEAAEAMCNDVRDIPAVRGLKMGDLIDASPKEVICKVMIEEKLFETWTHGRTVLIGDDQMHPAAGLGAQSAMCDAVVLANYIEALATVESRDVEKALKDYKDERYEIAKSAVQTSADMANIIKQDRDGKVARFIMNHMPKWLWASIRLKLASYRPQISFLPLIEDRCRVKATHQPSLRRVVLENSDDNKD
ncbi:hypothetical protein BGZ49_006685 [Haplosporangium sp. Z 27]|nr:hypothetical protein BGZ49_006685 [Haplosporangium sp. Z 27]